MEKVWEWGKLWYEGRLELNWRSRNVAEMETVFAELGLHGPFWDLH